MSDDLRLQKIKIQRAFNLVTETCSACGTLYAMEEEIHKERAADKNSFYCPNGHSQAYTGKSETAKLREQLDAERRERQRAEQAVAREADYRREAEAEAKHERARANGYKGHATRITKRAKAGVCACCNRSFENLRRHMETKHPQLTPMALEVIDGGKAVA